MKTNIHTQKTNVGPQSPSTHSPFAWIAMLTLAGNLLSVHSAYAGSFIRPRDPASEKPSPTNTPKPPPPKPSPTLKPTMAPTPIVTSSPPAPTGSPEAPAFKALWSDKHPQGDLWTQISLDVIQNQAFDLLQGSDDVEEFCPKYYSLDNTHRSYFWVQLLAAVTKYESAFDPTTRFVETTMGTDPITGKQVVSEGLLQLSYQDIRPYPYCEFNFQKDQQYGLKDLRRTILDPKIHLPCGIRILAQQVQRKQNIAISSGAYWSTLKVGSRYNQLAGIKKITSSVPFCKQ